MLFIKVVDSFRYILDAMTGKKCSSSLWEVMSFDKKKTKKCIYLFVRLKKATNGSYMQCNYKNVVLKTKHLSTCR